MSGPFPAPDVIAHDQAGLLVFGNQYRITRAFWSRSLVHVLTRDHSELIFHSNVSGSNGV